MIKSKNVANASSAIPTSDHDFEKISRLHAKSTGRSATFQVGSQHEPSWQLSVDPFADGFGKKQTAFFFRISLLRSLQNQ